MLHLPPEPAQARKDDGGRGVIRMTIQIEPVPKQRARVGKWGGYTPRKTAQFESTVASLVRAQMAGRIPMAGKIALMARFYCKPPKEFTRTYPCKADLDNLIKAFTDSCNGILWADDVQVARITAEKLYGIPPRIEFEVEEIT
jgi:Holliday junction resolvase RusA-like endonuclease